MEKTLNYLRRYLRYERPTDEEATAITGYIKSRAGSMIQGRSKEDLDDLPVKFIAEGLPVWRRKHPGLLKLSDQDLWRAFTWAVFEFLFEERDKWAKEKKGPVCDAGMIPASDESKDEVMLAWIGPHIPDEVLEDMERTRSQFQRALESHPAAGEWIEKQGTPCARLARRVLGQVYRHERTPEEALELLSVVLESNDLKFKERAKRLAMFLAVLEEYEKFDYQSYTEASTVTVYPSCGMSETPTFIPALSPQQVEGLRKKYGLTQGQLAEVFNINPTDVPEMKKRRSSGILQEEESLALEKEAESVLEARRAKSWESFEAVLMVKLRIQP